MPGSPKLETISITESEIRKKVNGSACSSVRVKLGDDTISTIAIGNSRRRISTFIETLAKLGPWTRLECLDKRGDTIAIVDNDSDAGELEDLGTSVDAKDTHRMERAFKIATEAILRGQREVLLMRDKETATVLGALSGVVKEVTNALHAVSEMHRAQLDSAVAAAEAAAESNQRDWVEQATELAEAAPQLAPLVQLLFSALGKKAPLPAGKTNGANGAAKATT